MYTAKSAKAIEEAFVLERVLERLRSSLEGSANAGGHLDLRLGLRDRVNRLAQRDARREIERDRHRGKLSLVIDGQRGLIVGEVREGAELDQPAGAGAHVDQVERLGVLPELRRDFHHDVVLVQRRVHRRHLPLPERVVERVVDSLLRESEPRSGVAIDDDVGLQAAVLLIAADVGENL